MLLSNTFCKEIVPTKGANYQHVLLRLRMVAYAFAYALLKTRQSSLNLPRVGKGSTSLLN